jgi:hypothetical protein
LAKTNSTTKHRQHDLPSWVMDWTDTDVPQYAGMLAHTRKRTVLAAEDRAQISCFLQSRHILLKGYAFDEVVSCTELDPKFETMKTLVPKMFQSWQTIALKSENNPYDYDPLNSGRSRHQAFCRTIIGDTLSSNLWTEPRDLWTSSQFLDLVKNFDEWLSTDHGLDKLDCQTRGRFQDFKTRMFVTRKGYIGLSDRTVSMGDLVCVLLGDRQPFIIQDQKSTIKLPLPDQSGHQEFRIHTLISGEVYVNGLADEAGMSLCREKGLPLEEICLA